MKCMFERNETNLFFNQLLNMKQSKITEIVKVNEWKWPNGTIFYINMKLENGELISLGKKKADAFKVWDTVSYEAIEENWKTKYKEVKENPFKPKMYDAASTNKSATIGMAMKIAFEVLYDAKKENFSECIALAHRIYDEAIAMYNEASWETTEKESAENDELPF